jgi:cell division protein FtsZ
MTSGKRASMREGPLAALFRKTETEGLQPGAQERAPEASQSAPGQPAGESGADVPDSAPGSGQQVPAQPVQPPQIPAPAAYPDPSPPQRPRPPAPITHGAAPVRPSQPAPETPGALPPQHAVEAASRVPTPQERLRHAFSADIPDNILTRAGTVVDEREPEEEPLPRQPTGVPQLRVIGVGGGGVNAVNRMIEAEIEGVEFVAVNTDAQSLQQSAAHVTLQIGQDVTRGLGSGSDPELGRTAAMDDYDRCKAILKGSDMVFIAAGEGGGTGTGAAPVMARIARELGALTVGIVTRPFGFEGTRRAQAAEEGIEMLAEEVDTLIVVPNNRLLSVLDKNTSMVDAFRVADDVLRQGVQGISDLITLPGLINLDFADVRTIMSDAGNALLGIGMGTGDKRAIEAAMKAVSSPLLETSVEGAEAILLSITGGRDLSLWEVNEAAKTVAEAAHPDANIIFGALVDEKLEDQVWVTVVATGYADSRRPARQEDRFQEPAGEPRVRRTGRERVPARAKSSGRGMDVDVPEFIPRF